MCSSAPTKLLRELESRRRRKGPGPASTAAPACGLHSTTPASSAVAADTDSGDRVTGVTSAHDGVWQGTGPSRETLKVPRGFATLSPQVLCVLTRPRQQQGRPGLWQLFPSSRPQHVPRRPGPQRPLFKAQTSISSSDNIPICTAARCTLAPSGFCLIFYQSCFAHSENIVPSQNRKKK